MSTTNNPRNTSATRRAQNLIKSMRDMANNLPQVDETTNYQQIQQHHQNNGTTVGTNSLRRPNSRAVPSSRTVTTYGQHSSSSSPTKSELPLRASSTSPQKKSNTTTTAKHLAGANNYNGGGVSGSLSKSYDGSSHSPATKKTSKSVVSPLSPMKMAMQQPGHEEDDATPPRAQSVELPRLALTPGKAKAGIGRDTVQVPGAPSAFQQLHHAKGLQQRSGGVGGQTLTRTDSKVQFKMPTNEKKREHNDDDNNNFFAEQRRRLIEESGDPEAAAFLAEEEDPLRFKRPVWTTMTTTEKAAEKVSMLMDMYPSNYQMINSTLNDEDVVTTGTFSRYGKLGGGGGSGGVPPSAKSSALSPPKPTQNNTSPQASGAVPPVLSSSFAPTTTSVSGAFPSSISNSASMAISPQQGNISPTLSPPSTSFGASPGGNIETNPASEEEMILAPSQLSYQRQREAQLKFDLEKLWGEKVRLAQKQGYSEGIENGRREGAAYAQETIEMQKLEAMKANDTIRMKTAESRLNNFKAFKLTDKLSLTREETKKNAIKLQLFDVIDVHQLMEDNKFFLEERDFLYRVAFRTNADAVKFQSLNSTKRARGSESSTRSSGGGAGTVSAAATADLIAQLKMAHRSLDKADNKITQLKMQRSKLERQLQVYAKNAMEMELFGAEQAASKRKALEAQEARKNMLSSPSSPTRRAGRSRAVSPTAQKTPKLDSNEQSLSMTPQLMFEQFGKPVMDDLQQMLQRSTKEESSIWASLDESIGTASVTGNAGHSTSQLVGDSFRSLVTETISMPQSISAAVAAAFECAADPTSDDSVERCKTAAKNAKMKMDVAISNIAKAAADISVATSQLQEKHDSLETLVDETAAEATSLREELNRVNTAANENVSKGGKMEKQPSKKNMGNAKAGGPPLGKKSSAKDPPKSAQPTPTPTPRPLAPPRPVQKVSSSQTDPLRRAAAATDPSVQCPMCLNLLNDEFETVPFRLLNNSDTSPKEDPSKIYVVLHNGEKAEVKPKSDRAINAAVPTAVPKVTPSGESLSSEEALDAAQARIAQLVLATRADQGKLREMALELKQAKNSMSLAESEVLEFKKKYEEKEKETDELRASIEEEKERYAEEIKASRAASNPDNLRNATRERNKAVEKLTDLKRVHDQLVIDEASQRARLSEFAEKAKQGEIATKRETKMISEMTSNMLDLDDQTSEMHHLLWQFLAKLRKILDIPDFMMRKKSLIREMKRTQSEKDGRGNRGAGELMAKMVHLSTVVKGDVGILQTHSTIIDQIVKAKRPRLDEVRDAFGEDVDGDSAVGSSLSTARGNEDSGWASHLSTGSHGAGEAHDALRRIKSLHGGRNDANNGGLKAVPGPSGKVSLVFTDIQSSTAWWQKYPKQMKIALEAHNVALRKIIEECNGYEVKTIGDAFMISFENSKEAAKFSLSVQNELMKITWDEVFNESIDPNMTFVAEESGAGEPKSAWNGLRVRIGIHTGEPICEIDSLSNRTDYFGPMVNLSARVQGAACGGQVLISDVVHSELKRAYPELGAHVQSAGSHHMKGIDRPMELFSIIPRNLAHRERDFQVQRENKKRKEEEEKQQKKERRRSKAQSSAADETASELLSEDDEHYDDMLLEEEEKFKTGRYTIVAIQFQRPLDFATKLWRKATTQVYDTLTQMVGDAKGAFSKDNKCNVFEVVFEDVNLGMRFALSLQSICVNLAWDAEICKLTEVFDTSSKTLLFRGLNPRIGVHTCETKASYEVFLKKQLFNVGEAPLASGLALNARVGEIMASETVLKHLDEIAVGSPTIYELPTTVVVPRVGRVNVRILFPESLDARINLRAEFAVEDPEQQKQREERERRAAANDIASDSFETSMSQTPIQSPTTSTGKQRFNQSLNSSTGKGFADLAASISGNVFIQVPTCNKCTKPYPSVCFDCAGIPCAKCNKMFQPRRICLRCDPSQAGFRGPSPGADDKGRNSPATIEEQPIRVVAGNGGVNLMALDIDDVGEGHADGGDEKQKKPKRAQGGAPSGGKRTGVGATSKFRSSKKDLAGKASSSGDRGGGKNPDFQLTSSPAPSSVLHPHFLTPKNTDRDDEDEEDIKPFPTVDLHLESDDDDDASSPLGRSYATAGATGAFIGVASSGALHSSASTTTSILIRRESLESEGDFSDTTRTSGASVTEFALNNAPLAIGVVTGGNSSGKSPGGDLSKTPRSGRGDSATTPVGFRRTVKDDLAPKTASEIKEEKIMSAFSTQNRLQSGNGGGGSSSAQSSSKTPQQQQQHPSRRKTPNVPDLTIS